MAVEAIEKEDFLSAEQKRDILYNTAARFLRLSPEQIARHHGTQVKMGEIMVHGNTRRLFGWSAQKPGSAPF